MATISGKDGKVKIGPASVAEITRWSFTSTSSNQALVTSSTGGFRKRIAGVKDASGSIAFRLDPGDPITNDFDEGDRVTLLLHIDAARYYSVPAIIDRINLEVDIDSGDVVGGTWTKPAYGA